MIVSWIKYYLLSCLVLHSSGVKRKCSLSIYEELRYCGKIKRYKELTKDTSPMYEYRMFGTFCYTNSKSIYNHRHQNFDGAVKMCLKDDARLAEFPLKKDWTDFMTDTNPIDTDDIFWIGAKMRRTTKWYWIQHGSQLSWSLWGADSKSSPCLATRYQGWLPDPCANRRPYVCQRIGKAAYEGKSTLTLSSADRAVRGAFFYGGNLQISCSAKTEKELSVTLTTPFSGRYTLYDIGDDRLVWNGIFFNEIHTNVSFYYEKYRCFRFAQLKVKLKLNLPVRGAEIVCSRRVLAAEKDRNLLNSYQDKEKVYFESVVKVEIHNLTKAAIKGERAVYECETFHISCTGIGVRKNQLQFKIINANRTYLWKYPDISYLPQWAKINWMEEFYNDTHDVSYKLDLKVTILRKMATARFLCEDLTFFKKIVMTEKLVNLTFKASLSEPPVLKQIKTENKDLLLKLRCLAKVGTGNINSWTITDSVSETQNDVQVGRGGFVHGVTFPWLKVEHMTESDSSLCVVRINSILTVDKKLPESSTILITCYSYDIQKPGTVRSNRSLEDLSASFIYPIPKGSQKRDYKDDDQDSNKDDKNEKDDQDDINDKNDKDDQDEEYGYEYSEYGSRDKDNEDGKDDNVNKEETGLYTFWYLALAFIGLVMFHCYIVCCRPGYKKTNDLEVTVDENVPVASSASSETKNEKISTVLSSATESMGSQSEVTRTTRTTRTKLSTTQSSRGSTQFTQSRVVSESGTH